MSKLKLAKDGLKLKILVYILIFVALYGVCGTSVYYAKLTPFGVGLVFALLKAKFNGYTLGIVYLVASSLSGWNWWQVLVGLNVSGVLALIQMLINLKKINLKFWHVALFSLLAQVGFFVGAVGDIRMTLACMVAIILGQMFLYACWSFFEATISRNLMVKLNLDEKICGAIILIVFVVGMSACEISIVNLGLVFVSAIILVATYLVGGYAIILSALMGIAFAIATMNPIYISLFVFLAIISLSFKCNFKYLSPLALIIGYLAFALFFDFGWTYSEIISVSIGAIIFSCVPLRFIYNIENLLMPKSHIRNSSVITNTKSLIKNRVHDLSLVFEEMNKVYKDMVKGNLPDSKAKEMLKDELVLSLCANCENKNICFRSSGNFLDNSLDYIVGVAYEKGKILLIDLPQYLTSNCNKLNQLIVNLNGLVSSYDEYKSAINNLDTSRLLIANQLGGVSKLLDTLSQEVDINISFNKRLEERIKEDLSYKKVICLDVAIYEKDIQTKLAHLLIKTDTIDKPIIEKSVGRILNSKMLIKEILDSDIPGAKVVILITKPNYDMAFGSSSINKLGNQKCGDSYVFSKIDDGKFMLALCDGMGAGESAHNISRLTISLIENFYRAGFENEIILSSINKLLSLSEQENYSTIDICVVDGKQNTYDFIKLGATSGYLKRDKGETEVIDSSGLPVGVLEEIKPHITRKLINPMDMLVLMSDGVADSFEGRVDLARFIAGCDCVNPQTLSEIILNKALELNENINTDDMTVICARLFNIV